MSGSPISPTSTLFPSSPLLSPKDHKSRAEGRAAAHAIQALLDTTSLVSEADVDTAVAQLDHILSDLVSGDIHEFVSVLGYIPYLLEFILSVSSDYVATLLSSAITTHPNTAQEFLFSTASRLLNQFSLSLSDAPFAKTTAHRRSIELASSALETLTRLEACDTLPEEELEQSDSRWAAKSREKRERGRRRSTVFNRGTVVDRQPIRDYGERVPTSKPHARALAMKIIGDQMAVLKDFLQELRTDAIAQYVKEQYLPYLIPTGPLKCLGENEATIFSPQQANIGTVASPTSESQDLTLYFANANGFGPWRLSISTRAGRDLRRASNEDAKRFDIILKTIRDLSNGHFTKDNHKILAGGKIDAPIYEAKMTRDWCFIYHIHCDLDFESKVERQVIRVFGIYTHAQIDQRFWDAMSRQLGSQGPEYRKRCLYRRRATERDYAVLPGEFPPREETPPTALPPVSEGMTRENMEQLHSLLALEKFVTFSQELLNSIIADQDVAHVFDLSPREQEIMAHPFSCFVIGRSGTGKTTTMLFKMLAKERSWADRFQASMSKPRQLFVTQSMVLAQKVQEYFARLTQAFDTANLSPVELRKMATASEHRCEAVRIRMVNEDEEIQWNSTLPSRYGALSDADFPLFVTYDHLCRLLEGEFRYLLETNRITSAQAMILRDVLQLRPGTSTWGARASYMADKKFSFVNYDGFREDYWAKFPVSLKQGLNPELVFGEFLGVIKGSEEALACETGFLSQEVYCGIEDPRTGDLKIGRRIQATSREHREAIYALFKVYTRMKKASSQYDAADRTRMLIKCFGATGVPGRPLSFIYVDEVQDNLLIDSLVLRKLCSNPHSGLFWAGDTAQTISTGSAFRFNDLKVSMYNASKAGMGSFVKLEPSETFHLTTNYRSHSGIVDCAYSLVEVVVKYWPDSIDRLPREHGMTPGPKPLFFSNGDGGELQRALFRDTEGGSIEFGTNQCILVRNDAARQRLRTEMGDLGQILTIYESKGLEFNDVLLYNPFEDSSVSYSQWSVLLNEVEGQRAPVFEEAKFTDICRELKHLYVAITRARMNLWIFDCSSNAEPLRLLWMTKNLIDVHPPNEPVPRLAVSSSKEEWAASEAARSLFSKGQYSEAKLGFERAGLHHERDIAYAYLLKEQALSALATSRAGTGPSQPRLFLQAAKQFKAIAKAEESKPEKRAYYRIAAECYGRCGAHHKAGTAYRAAEEYTLAAQAFRKAGSFDYAVEIIKSHADAVQPEVVQKIKDVSRLHYIREGKIDNARELFENDEEVLQYMDDYGFNSSRAAFLERLGRLPEAAECLLQEGDRLKAIELLVRDHSESSTARAAECILDGLWQLLSLCTPEKHWQNNMIPDLLGQFELLERTWVSGNALNELLMFRAVFADDIAELAELGDIFARVDNPAATILCFDQVFSHPLALGDEDLAGITICLGRFLSMVRTLAWFVCRPSPCDQKAIQKLLAFRPSSEETFLVFSSTHLFALCNKQSTPGMQTTTNGALIPRWELEPLVKTTLRDRLKGHVYYQNEMCHTDLHEPGRLQPCLLFAANQQCPKDDCRQIHVEVQHGVTTYNTLIRIHVIQIMIYRTLYACDISCTNLFHQQRLLLRRLYDSLYPAHISLGSLHVLSVDSIPELKSGRHIISVWLRDFLNTIDPSRETTMKHFLTDLAKTSVLAMVFARAAAARTLHRIPCVMRFTKPQLLIRTGGHYAVQDLISAIQCEDAGAFDRGIMFLNHILRRRIAIDIGVLCDILDFLCGGLLMARSFQKNRTLHGLTLPKSWMARFVNIGGLAYKKTSRLEEYTAHLGQLLQWVYTGQDASHLLFGKMDLSDHRLGCTRVIYFQRICKNMCFYAQNSSSWRLKEDVVRMISAVPFDHSQRSSMCTRYAEAGDWPGMLKVALNSVAETKIDELIQLRQHGHLVTSTIDISAFKISYLHYSQTEDITTLLNVQHIAMLSSDNIYAGEPSRQRLFSQSTRRAVGGHRAHNSPLHDSPPSPDNDPGDESDDPQAEFTEEERNAASLISTAYKKYLARKAAEKDVVTVMRRRKLDDYKTRSEGMTWSSVVYRQLFRLAVPRLLIATEFLKDHLHAAKKHAKAKLSKVKHEELERVQGRLDEVSRLFKEACSLHKSLVPIAHVHKMCDLEELRGRARRVEKLHDQVESGSKEPFPWRVDVQLAMALLENSV